MSKKFFITWYLCLFNVLLFAQHTKFEWVNTDNGLPQNSVKNITRDNSGYIWLSTENGLVRYDGYNFESFNNFNTNNQSFSIFFSNNSKDTIYIKNVFEENLVGIFNRKTFVSNKIIFEEELKLKNGKKYTPLIGSDIVNDYSTKRNYKFQFQNGWYFIDEENFTFENNKNKVEKIIDFKLQKSSLGKCFTQNEFLFFVDTKSKKVFQFENETIKNVIADPVFFSEKSEFHWSQINNQVFILNQAILYIVKFENNKLSAIKFADLKSIINYGIRSLYYDPFYNKLFIGTPANGLCIVSFSKFNAVKKSDLVFDAVVYSQLPFDKSSIIDPNGIVYSKNGIINNFNFFRENDNDKQSMVYDSKGNIWVKNYHVIYKYSKNHNYKIIDSIQSIKQINSIYNFKNFNAICFLGKDFSGVLNLYEKDDYKNIIKTFTFKKNINFIKQISDDELLVGTRDGLHKVSISKNSNFRIDKIKAFNIRNIVKTSSGNIWILTSGKGYFLLKNNQLFALPLDKENSLKIVHTILEDKMGFFWISTNNGLFKIKETDLLDYINHKKKCTYYKFTKEEGFNTNEFNGGCSPCGTILKNGEFVLPSLDGFVFFNPNTIKSFYPSKVFVERARIDNNEISFFENTLSLENNFFRADIFIDVPYFSNPENLCREVWLEGKSLSWEKIGENGIYSLTNLEHGNYILKIRVLKNSDGKYMYKTINLNVVPLYYQTMPFKLSAFILFIILLYVLYEIRVKYLKIKNLELEETINSRTKELKISVDILEFVKAKLDKETLQQKKLIGSISHDITTPIKYLSITAEKLYKSNDNDLLSKKNYLESIYKSTLELYNFSKALKDYALLYSNESNNENYKYNLHDLVQEKIELFKVASNENGNNLYNKIHKDKIVDISKNVLAVILHNLIDNAIKYTFNGEISISNIEDNTYYNIEINDTGKGLTEAQIDYYDNLQKNVGDEKLLLQKFGLGLNLVLQLLPIINGEISFHKKSDSGTKIILKFKKITTNES